MVDTHPSATSVKDHLALALDTDDLVGALRLARDLEPWFGVAKVGLELFSATGPDVVTALTDRGWKVFLDLKFHDIPTTVARAARVIGALGASYLTLDGGTDMVRAGVEGLLAGASAAGLDAPGALAVTVLTSDDAEAHVFERRVATAVEAGCRGIVCAASDVREAKQLAPRLMAVVPGIRLHGSPTHDQARPATPEAALGAGADLLVIGRTVTGAEDRYAAAAAVTAAAEEALAARL